MSTRADRPYGRFPSSRDAVAAPPPAPRTLTRAERLRIFLRRLAPVALGALLTLVAVALWQRSPSGLDERQVQAIVQQALASQTPAPHPAVAAYEAIQPSLVHIRASSGDGARHAEGSGVVVDDSASILTAFHVVRDLPAVSVLFADGTESPARVVASSAENDIAVLRAAQPPASIVPAVLGSPGALRPGDQVIAVGDPLGLVGSVSAGVVSGLGRSFHVPQSDRELAQLIQFDASVNPGSSGGPLLDRDGEVVGIVVGLVNAASQPAFAGIGFAVPIENATPALGIPPD